MGDYESLHVEEQARSHSVMGHNRDDDPFYKNVQDLKPETNETPRTLASAQDATKLVVAKNPKNGM